MDIAKSRQGCPAWWLFPCWFHSNTRFSPFSAFDLSFGPAEGFPYAKGCRSSVAVIGGDYDCSAWRAIVRASFQPDYWVRHSGQDPLSEGKHFSHRVCQEQWWAAHKIEDYLEPRFKVRTEKYNRGNIHRNLKNPLFDGHYGSRSALKLSNYNANNLIPLPKVIHEYA